MTKVITKTVVDKVKNLLVVDVTYDGVTYTGIKVPGCPKKATIDETKNHLREYMKAYVAGKAVEVAKAEDFSEEQKTLFGSTINLD
jgi:hypothetical protein